MKIHELAIKQNLAIYFCKAFDRIKNKGNSQNINNIINNIILTKNEPQMGNLMTKLPLILNTKYLLTYNVNTELGLVNGAELILREICIDKSNTKLLKFDGTLIFELDNQPKYLIVELLNKNITSNRFKNLPENHIPIFSIDQDFYVDFCGKKSLIKRNQFPLTLPYCLTIHKAQVKTLEKGIVDLNLPPKGKSDKQFAYVALSRLKSIESLYILRYFKQNILQQESNLDLLEEISRLQKIESKSSFLNLVIKIAAFGF